MTHRSNIAGARPKASVYAIFMAKISNQIIHHYIINMPHLIKFK